MANFGFPWAWLSRQGSRCYRTFRRSSESILLGGCRSRLSPLCRNLARLLDPGQPRFLVGGVIATSVPRVPLAAFCEGACLRCGRSPQRCGDFPPLRSWLSTVLSCRRLRAGTPSLPLRGTHWRILWHQQKCTNGATDLCLYVGVWT